MTEIRETMIQGLCLSLLSRCLPDPILEKIDIEIEYVGGCNGRLKLPWLNTDQWRNANEILTDYGFKYVADGRNTHYTIPNDLVKKIRG
jgi:hypothetical protein